MTSSNLNEMTTAAGGTKGEAADPCNWPSRDPLWDNPTPPLGAKQRVDECRQKGKCFGVDPRYQWVLMGVETGPTDTFLLVAAEKPISGVECHWLWDKQDIPDYWELAWQEANDQTYSVLKEESIGLAINALGDPSKPCRRHNQLHIHICRIDKFDQTQGVHSLREQLVDIDKKITRTPADLSRSEHTLYGHKEDQKGNLVPDNGLRYHVLVLNSPDPKHPFRYQYVEQGQTKEGNLFHLLRYNTAKDDADMANQSLVVCQRTGGGFYIINGWHGVGSCAGTNLLWSPSKCQ